MVHVTSARFVTASSSVIVNVSSVSSYFQVVSSIVIIYSVFYREKKNLKGYVTVYKRRSYRNMCKSRIKSHTGRHLATVIVITTSYDSSLLVADIFGRTILTVQITTKLACAQCWHICNASIGVLKSLSPVSRGTSSAYLSKLFLLFGPSCQVTPFWDLFIYLFIYLFHLVYLPYASYND